MEPFNFPIQQLNSDKIQNAEISNSVHFSPDTNTKNPKNNQYALAEKVFMDNNWNMLVLVNEMITI